MVFHFLFNLVFGFLKEYVVNYLKTKFLTSHSNLLWSYTYFYLLTKGVEMTCNFAAEQWKWFQHAMFPGLVLWNKFGRNSLNFQYQLHIAHVHYLSLSFPSVDKESSKNSSSSLVISCFTRLWTFHHGLAILWKNSWDLRILILI